MAKGARLALVQQASLVWSQEGVDEFLETGSFGDVDMKIPYDPAVMEAIQGQESQ